MHSTLSEVLGLVHQDQIVRRRRFQFQLSHQTLVDLIVLIDARTVHHRGLHDGIVQVERPYTVHRHTATVTDAVDVCVDAAPLGHGRHPTQRAGVAQALPFVQHLVRVHAYWVDGCRDLQPHPIGMQGVHIHTCVGAGDARTQLMDGIHVEGQHQHTRCGVHGHELFNHGHQRGRFSPMESFCICYGIK